MGRQRAGMKANLVMNDAEMMKGWTKGIFINWKYGAYSVVPAKEVPTERADLGCPSVARAPKLQRLVVFWSSSEVSLGHHRLYIVFCACAQHIENSRSLIRRCSLPGVGSQYLDSFPWLGTVIPLAKGGGMQRGSSVSGIYHLS